VSLQVVLLLEKITDGNTRKVHIFITELCKFTIACDKLCVIVDAKLKHS